MGAPIRIRCKRRKVPTRHDQINAVCTKYSTVLRSSKHCASVLQYPTFIRNVDRPGSWWTQLKVLYANGLCFLLLVGFGVPLVLPVTRSCCQYKGSALRCFGPTRGYLHVTSMKTKIEMKRYDTSRVGTGSNGIVLK